MEILCELWPDDEAQCAGLGGAAGEDEGHLAAAGVGGDVGRAVAGGVRAVCCVWVGAA